MAAPEVLTDCIQTNHLNPKTAACFCHKGSNRINFACLSLSSWPEKKFVVPVFASLGSGISGSRDHKACTDDDISNPSIQITEGVKQSQGSQKSKNYPAKSSADWSITKLKDAWRKTEDATRNLMASGQKTFERLLVEDSSQKGHASLSAIADTAGTAAERGQKATGQATNSIQEASEGLKKKTKGSLLNDKGNISEQGDNNLERAGHDGKVAMQHMRVPVHNLAVKRLLCGALAGGLGGALTTPLQVAKTRAMADHGSSSVAGVIKYAVKREGRESNLLNVDIRLGIVCAAVSRGLQFFTFEGVKRWEKEHIGHDPHVLPLPRAAPNSSLAGALAGLVSTLATYPMECLLDRSILQSEKYKGLSGAISTVLKEEGIRGLYRGIWPAVIGIVPTTAISYYTYDTLKNQYEERYHKTGPLQNLIFGAAAGIASSSLTYPLEAARKQISMSILPEKAMGAAGNVQYDNLVQAVVGIVKAEGWQGLYKGMPAQLLAVVPMTAITFLVYEAAKRVFVAQSEESPHEVKSG